MKIFSFLANNFFSHEPKDRVCILPTAQLLLMNFYESRGFRTFIGGNWIQIAVTTNSFKMAKSSTKVFRRKSTQNGFSITTIIKFDYLFRLFFSTDLLFILHSSFHHLVRLRIVNFFLPRSRPLTPFEN